MKVRFDKKKLMEVLDPASSISQTKNTLMTVDGLLFECPPDRNYGEYDVENPDSCRISAFDLDKGMRGDQGGGKGNGQTKFVYCYEITSKTKE